MPGDRLIIDIVFKYNTNKVIYIIATEDKWTKNAGIPHLSKYPIRFDNVSIIPVSCPIVMSTLFGSVTKVYSQKIYRQSDLDLEKYWVTQCCWMRLCAEVSMGMNIENLWTFLSWG